MIYLGSFTRGGTVPLPFPTRDGSGTLITFAGTPLLRTRNAATRAIIEDNLAPTVNVGSVTGQHTLTVTLGASYDGITEVLVDVKQGTVDGVSVANEIIFRFSIDEGVLPAGAIDDDAVATSAVTKLQNGLALATDLAVVDSLVDTLVARLTSARAGYLDNLSGGAVALNADAATLLTRLSATRAGYLDKLNISGNVASSAEATAIQNNTRVVRVVPPNLQRPTSGSTVFTLELFCYDDVGGMEAPDSAPTVDVVNQAGTSRTANLSSTTMTLVSAGRYRVTYSVAFDATPEQLIFAFSVVEGGATRVYGNTAQVVDTLASDFTSTDRSKLDALFAKLPSKAYLTGTANADGDVQLNEATGTPADSAGVGTLLTRASEARLSELDAATAGKLAHDIEQVLLTDRLTAARATALGDLIDGGRLDLILDAVLSGVQAVPSAAANALAVRSNFDGTALAAPGAPPAADASPLAKLAWVFHLARFAVEQTATEQRVKSEAGATIAAAPVTDAAGVTTRGAFAAP